MSDDEHGSDTHGCHCEKCGAYIDDGKKPASGLCDGCAECHVCGNPRALPNLSPECDGWHRISSPTDSDRLDWLLSRKELVVTVPRTGLGVRVTDVKLKRREDIDALMSAALHGAPPTSEPLEWLQTTRRGVAPLTMDDQHGEPTRHLWVVDGADASCIMPTVREAIERAREKLGDEPVAEEES